MGAGISAAPTRISANAASRNAYDEGAVAQSVAEDGQPGEDRG